MQLTDGSVLTCILPQDFKVFVNKCYNVIFFRKQTKDTLNENELIETVGLFTYSGTFWVIYKQIDTYSAVDQKLVFCKFLFCFCLLLIWLLFFRIRNLGWYSHK